MGTLPRPNWHAMAVAAHRVGNKFRDRERWAKALAQFELARRLEARLPRSERSWGSIGMTLHEIASTKARLRDFEGALKTYQLAVRAKKRVLPRHRTRFEYATTLHELGITFRGLERNKEALAAYRAAVAEDARSRSRNWSARVRTLRSVASLLREAEDWPAALLAYLRTRRAIEKIPARRRDWFDYATVLDRLMWLQVETRNLRKAVETGKLARLAYHRIPPRARDAKWRKAYRETLEELAFALAHVGTAKAGARGGRVSGRGGSGSPPRRGRRAAS